MYELNNEYKMQKKEALMLLQIIHEATQWLMGLTNENVIGLKAPEPNSVRIFTEEECEYVSLPCRRFLLALEQQGIVNAAVRERIIHHVMELQVKNIDPSIVEGITRIILSHQPEGQNAIARMELLTAELDSHVIH